ncbi:putative mitochondrial hypothetical protein [Leptomonas pyrrhocoris]|uniref:Uncharacterized protein n=1 Tax=Leptomonas pyrrhocoris TaxID=157538 RepID=A0A0N0DXM1_LEPPY|nr:putative mitochondrial hypothetical protein [Leptomonas pyrrhocoris]KPA83112.1 putative mitochondrial hypothetical protein [Leptomonas pyrrhocoris]|eukprot:XP_015661551.1 putative mitochondrial hypothetical protein [Leptomonas pyrrhocoris]
MLRCTQALLGRWSSRDFLRGRSKRAGAVHTRHTHGRQGRYKRLSTVCSSIRDGRRHAGNHMQGGLGIKLGGGLFGLRIPRQHQLSHMSKEEYDLEIHGHPNITNPYREHLDEHPDLKSVMMNATVAVKMVVLLPRVARNGDGADAATVVPAKWKRVVRDVSDALEFFATPRGETTAEAAAANGSRSVEASGPSVEVHFATLGTSVCCQWPSCLTCPLSSSSLSDAASSLRELLEESVGRLYRTHCKLGQTLKLEKSGAPHPQHSPQLPRDSSSPSARRRKHPAVFLGAALKAPGGHGAVTASSSSRPLSSVGAVSSAPPSFTSFVLAQLTNDASASTDVSFSGVAHRLPQEPSMTPNGGGFADVVHHLSATERPLLRVCVRLSSVREHSDSSALPAALPSTIDTSCSSSSAAAVPRKVLACEVDANADLGVWRQAASPLRELLRWHYCAQDPRAHNHDALPHHRRSLPLLVVVDASTADATSSLSSTRAATGRGGFGNSAPTLMPRRLSVELESTGFHRIAETSLLSVAEAIAAWSPSAQWERFAQSAPSSSPTVPAELHHGSACVSC